eukprot:1534827-Rhodomonas_salina.1
MDHGHLDVKRVSDYESKVRAVSNSSHRMMRFSTAVFTHCEYRTVLSICHVLSPAHPPTVLFFRAKFPAQA